MTGGCELATSSAAGASIKELGEVMAPASIASDGAGAAPIRRTLRWIALAAACLGTACDDPGARASRSEARPLHDDRAADPADGVETELDGTTPRIGDGVLAALTGDDAAARDAFEQLLVANDVPAEVAARAALQLAQLEVRAGKAGRAKDLIARATALAPNDPTVIEGADRVRAEIVAASGAGDIRGPKLGTPLPGVDAETAAAFASAERALARVHAMRPRQRLAVWEKEDATAAVVRRYRAIAEAGGVAQVAAAYRIGSLYHDLALGLMFEPVAADLRRTLFTGARNYLKKATVAYRESLAGTSAPEAELWRLAAETDLRAALDVLGETGR